jgi:hypothetical protein
MKKLLVLAIISTIATTSQAQLFYIQGGANLANITKNSDGDTEDNNMLTTFNVGAMGRFGLSKQVDIETGILFTGRGSKAETYWNGGTDYVKAKFNPYYLEIPVNLVLSVPMQNSTSLFFNAGPYVAMGIAGKSKLETKIGAIATESESDIEFSNDDPLTSEEEEAGYNRLKRFDYGINVGAGLDLKSVILKANYGLGLTDINSVKPLNGEDNNKYRTISISVGIPLGR